MEAVFWRLVQAGTAQGGRGSGRDDYLEELLASWFYHGDRQRRVTKEIWMELCRHLAFLTTDLEERGWPDHTLEEEDRPRQILLARWHTLGLLLASGFAYQTSWWLFAIANLISFLLFQASWRRHDLPKDQERAQALKRRREYHPFADQADWLAHKHLADEYHLPTYEAGEFDQAPSTWRWSSIIALPASWTGYCVVAAMFCYAYLFFVALWPVWLVKASLHSRINAQPRQTTS